MLHLYRAIKYDRSSAFDEGYMTDGWKSLSKSTFTVVQQYFEWEKRWNLVNFEGIADTT